MFGKMNVLQLGKTNFETKYQIPDGMHWFYEPDWEDEETLAELKAFRQFDAAIIDRPVTGSEVEKLIEVIRAYGLFIFEDADYDMDYLMKSRKGERIERENFQDFIDHRLIHFYTDTYGERFPSSRFVVNQKKDWKITYAGYEGAIIEGDFGDEFQQMGCWNFNVPIEPEMGIDLWLEYEKDYSVELRMDVYSFRPGSVDGIQEEYHFNEDEIESKEYLTIVNHQGVTGHIFVSLQAKGSGIVVIKNLHDRWSRFGEGIFLPGGERRITTDREEAFFYFEPGDLKPPLNVYFSGYKTREGFEGYGIMRAMKSPFLLIADQRLEGGDFYVGTKEYETMIQDKILEVMDELRFTSKDLIFAGLSMGTSGAMYYGSLIGPEYIILGKPLADLGTMAENERINRPGGFPTSLDVLGKTMGDLSAESVDGMNARFWTNFGHGNWGHTTFVISYMYEDDYDGNAYQTLLRNLGNSGTRIFGKGLHGRHNDDTQGIVSWFYKQYKIILRDYFNRKIEV